VSIPSSVFIPSNAKSPDVPGGVDITMELVIVSPVIRTFTTLFLRASVIAARKCLRVNGGFSEPPPKRKEGGGTPKGAPW
jgi:hypothetical protein